MQVTVDPTDGLGQEELLRRLQAVAERAAQAMYPGQDVGIEHINQSENTTYIATPSDAERSILRIHRTGYHSEAAIRSEHAWLEALRTQTDVRTPEVLRNPRGDTITQISTEQLPGGRACVFFELLDGEEPDPDELHRNLPALGEVTARMHLHTLDWQLPDDFERFHWNLDTVFGDHPHWGHWYDAPGLDEPTTTLLSALVALLKRRLTAFGMGPQRFGLVHADMRLANLLLHNGEARVIDFDDCGFSWYLYDLATAMSFIEERSDVMELIERWLEGYLPVRSLSQEELDEIPTFLMLRRMLIIAWIGSHAETELAAELGTDFVTGTSELAESYLRSHG